MEQSSNFKWTDEKVIDFVNWYIKLQKLNQRYVLENITILDSFKKGDDVSLWHTHFEDNFDERFEALVQTCFHMNNEQAEAEIDKFIADNPDVLGYYFNGIEITRDWLIKHV